ncbi:Protein of unknown function [Cotesia congregata]|uniref:Uncharacterized protein n=1 Tax=Cotesia congregata TaxID=51543 RepID=A0A8J2H515_COTCN|nr:Protein of unknown function [Cotesia congregata]
MLLSGFLQGPLRRLEVLLCQLKQNLRFPEPAFEFLVTQLLARGRVIWGSTTPVYITLSAGGGDKISFAIGPGAPIPLPLYLDWRAFLRRIAASESPDPRAPIFLDTVFGSRAPLRRIAIPELLTWR